MEFCQSEKVGTLHKGPAYGGWGVGKTSRNQKSG